MRFQIHMPSIPSGKFTRRLFLFVIATMLAFCHGTYAQGPGQSSNLLTQVETIPLEGVEGRIDHLGLDAKGKRLFVAALGNDTVEVVDLDSARDRPRMPSYQAHRSAYLRRRTRDHAARPLCDRGEAEGGRCCRWS